MIDNNTIDFYNSRLTVDISQPSKLTTSQKDQVRHYGSLAEALLKNIAEFALQNLSVTNETLFNEPLIFAPPITSLKLDIGQ